eukprot:TRINITY_DN1434_c0_g2_i2.p1 TRINITY_DN1434_c0_g2~~TRINITY_DN1434_c0_g2_i2.p1  ORF type:complete len:364 (-),score=37.94 TRINITY_DN1434_c0_g2_i2:96-1187(-)
MADPKVQVVPTTTGMDKSPATSQQQAPPSSPQAGPYAFNNTNGGPPMMAYPPAYYPTSASHFYPYPPTSGGAPSPQQPPHGYYYQPPPPGYLPPVQQPPPSPTPMRTYGTLQPPSSATPLSNNNDSDLLGDWRGFDRSYLVQRRFFRMMACGTFACLSFFCFLVLLSAMASGPAPSPSQSPQPYPQPTTNGPCPDGKQPVNCFVDPCLGNRCKYGCTTDNCKGCVALCTCHRDSHCNTSSEWCRDGLCVPLQQEGQACGGYTTASNMLFCAPNLKCAVPPGTIDAEGVCRRPCVSPADGKTKMCNSRTEYCAKSSQTCLTNGACLTDSDCAQRDNNYVVMCVGTAVCNAKRTCEYNCVGVVTH